MINPLSSNKCGICGCRNLHAIPVKRTPQETNNNAWSNKLGLSKEEATELLITGFIDELSEMCDLPEVPLDVERVIKLFALRSFEWTQNHLQGNFRLSGYMNECVERTWKGILYVVSV